MDLKLQLRLRETRGPAAGASSGRLIFWVALVVLVALLDPAAADGVIRVLEALAGNG